MTENEKLYWESINLLLKISRMIRDEYNEAKEMRLRRIERIMTRRVQRRMKLLEAYDD
jgi:hypothetical protein